MRSRCYLTVVTGETGHPALPAARSGHVASPRQTGRGRAAAVHYWWIIAVLFAAGRLGYRLLARRRDN
jgi:hypothetical protein